jgi:type II restriction/modification system DNA methylase subunit YeeA
MPEAEAAKYERPFEYVRAHVRPGRVGNNRAAYAERWWIHEEARSGLRQAIGGLARYITTIRHSKHRLFVWLPAGTLPDSALVVFGRDDDYAFGVLQSRPHELWSRSTGTQLREAESGFRYTPTTCFETFPFPRPTETQRLAIGGAVTELNRLRDGWLNPPGLAEPELAKRTLTNLYNQRPSWLANAHADLDRAVLYAYGWPADLDDDGILERLLELNLERTPA